MSLTTGPRPLVFNAFLTNTVSHIHHGMWRHPDSRQADYTDLNLWIDLVRTLERGHFDAIFFADTLGPMDVHEGGWKSSVREGLQIPSGDPVVLISALAAATEHLGLVATSSIQTEHPFVHARRFSTLDHITRGRVGWNIVTSTRRSEARNLGRDDAAPHAERYAAAEEYAQVVYKLWERSWEDGAVIRDRAAGRYSDETKVHAIDHEGPRYPGQAPRRHPFIQGLTFVVGATDDEAKRKSAEIDEWLSDEAMLAHMSGTIGVDFAAIDLDRPIGDFTTERTQGIVASLAAAAADKSKTFRELARWAWSQRVVGTPEQIAEQLNRWRHAGVDGVNVIYITLPGTYADFIDHVAPVLAERGLMQREYRPGTLREKLFPGRGPRFPESHPARQVRIPADSEKPVR